MTNTSVMVVDRGREPASHGGCQAYAHAQCPPEVHVMRGSPIKTDGNPSAYEPHEIAVACDCSADHSDEDRGQRLIDTLVKERFLDRLKGCLLVSQWSKHPTGSGRSWGDTDASR